jgi:hypothetical protein
VKPTRDFVRSTLSLLTARCKSSPTTIMSTWKSKRGAEKRPPDLDDCIENIESLSDDKFKSTKNVGQLYVAAIGLVYHLRLDQETIFSIRYVYFCLILIARLLFQFLKYEINSLEYEN